MNTAKGTVEAAPGDITPKRPKMNQNVNTMGKVIKYDFGSGSDPDEMVRMASYRSHNEAMATLAGVGDALQFVGHAVVQPTGTLFPGIIGDIRRATLVTRAKLDGGAVAGEFAAIGICFPLALMSIMVTHLDNDNMCRIQEFSHVTGAWDSLDNVAEYGAGSYGIHKLQVDITRVIDINAMPSWSLSISASFDGTTKFLRVKQAYGSGNQFQDIACPIILTTSVNATVDIDWLNFQANVSEREAGIMELISS